MLANPSIVYKLKTSVQNISLKVYYSHILLNVHYTITCQVGECLFDRVYIKYIRYFVLRFLLDLSQRPFREWSSRTSRHDMYISQAGTLCTCTIEGGDASTDFSAADTFPNFTCLGSTHLHFCHSM